LEGRRGRGEPPFSLTQTAYPWPLPAGSRLGASALSLDYASALREAQEEIARFRKEKAQALERYHSQPGWELQVRPPGSGCGFAASGASMSWRTAPGSSPQWRLCPALSQTSAQHDRPPAISGEEWKFFVGPSLELRVDGKPAALASGKTAFKSLSMRAPGFELDTTRPGRLVNDGKSLRLEWDGPWPAPCQPGLGRRCPGLWTWPQAPRPRSSSNGGGQV